MLNYDDQYRVDYSALVQPHSPIMPNLKYASSDEIRQYADELDAYHQEMEKYKEQKAKLDAKQAELNAKFKHDLEKEYNFPKEVHEIIFNEAYSDGHSYGYNQVAYEYEKYANLVQACIAYMK